MGDPGVAEAPAGYRLAAHGRAMVDSGPLIALFNAADRARSDGNWDATAILRQSVSDRMDIAYGLYIYHVESPGVGEHTGKFAVIK